MHRPVALGIVSLLCFASLSYAGEKDYYLSVPAKGAIWKVDAQTKIGAPFVEGVLIPHYGHFWPDGTFYMPDRGWPALLKISPNGVTTALTAGGMLQQPVTCIPSQDGNSLILSDMQANAIFQIGLSDGSQKLLHDNNSLGGLLDYPDGMAYDDDGNLFVANLVGNTIVKIDPRGAGTLFASGLNEPAGLVIDGAGNLFVANYGESTILRYRIDTGESEVFAAADLSKMSYPSDLKLARSGGLLASSRTSTICRIDAMGQIHVEFQDTDLGEIVGVSVPEDATLCSGRFYTEESGVPGSGGFVPKIRAIFSPCPGQIHGLELKDFPGGKTAYLLLGLGAANMQVAGIKLYVDLAQPYWLMPLPLPGSGPGEGDLRMQFTVPEIPGIVGIHLYYQAIAIDSGAATGKVYSNRLHEVIGS